MECALTPDPTEKSMTACVDRIISRFGDGSRQRKRSHDDPVTSQEEDLYRLLYPCLVEHKSNVASFIMGSRGSGKSRLVEKVISRIDDSKFWTLRLNGLIFRGNDVGFAVHELVRQLSELALTKEMGKKDTDLLRLKRTSFTSNLALLDEAFQLAKAENKPILIVLDELDAFAGSNAGMDMNPNLTERAHDRQLLLYHILDRVAKTGSLLCFIGITSHLATVSLLEKRVRSRAEGTSKTIFVNAFDSYSSLTYLILTKFDGEGGHHEQLKASLASWLRNTGEASSKEIRQIRQLFERSYRTGKDVRWFTRVLSVALSLFREDLREAEKLQENASTAETTLAGASNVSFKPDYLLEALGIMGASTAGCEDVSMVIDPRIQVLTDLSGPQVSLLLSARRILSRDEEEDQPKPLTLHRMMEEFQSYQGHTNRYSRRLLHRAFTQMLEMDVFRPSADHSGGGPLQYEYSGFYAEMDATTIMKLPLHLPYTLGDELTRALKDNQLDCSTALREWGKRKN